MAVKTVLTAVMTTLLLAPNAMAQVQPADPFEARTYGADPFAPRIYGSTEVVRAVQPGAAHAPAVTTQVSSNVTRVVEPVTQDIQATITAPLTFSDTGVVKAQHFKQGDLSPQAYQELLDEADRVRSYQSTTQAYTGISYEAASPVENTYVEPAQTYQIELFAPEVASVTEESIGASELYGSDPVVTYATTTVIEPVPAPAQTHIVRKGDTLYNISKRYAVSIDELRSTNDLTGNNIGLGQTLTLPFVAPAEPVTTLVTTTVPVAQSIPVAQPVPVAQTIPVTTSRPVTLVRNVEPVPGASSPSSVYAVLPKDTLYSISRRSCVSVGDLISTNGISNPNSLQPGQKLNMPAGHCLN